MHEVSRRKVLIAGSAIGAAGALGGVAPAVARPAWTWAAKSSLAGSGRGIDPQWVWDEEVDALMAAVIDRGDVPLVNEHLRTWSRNDQPVPSGLPSDVRAWMERARQLPAWADQAKLRAAARFNESRGILLNLCNGPGGGMLSTAIPREARAVYYSKGGADMEDRVAKTSILGFSVGDLNAYEPDGDCIVQAVKTRMVHASVRHLLPQSPHWAGTSGGQKIPISIADVLVTWHSLPTWTMQKLLEWRVRLTTEESEGYLHSWQVTAHMLGVPDEYIPASWEAANAQSTQLFDPVLGPTPEGVILTDILLGQLAEQTSPFSVSRPLVDALARFLVGDKIADWDGIDREPVWEAAIRTVWPAFIALREGAIKLPLVPRLAWTIDEIARAYLMFYLTKGKGTVISIPDRNRTFPSA
ncbi:oxygenase MpaB family protein [Mumia sp. DW29H23]|uniref:oxygenase MpaB family protein n=1 Tax=Mumia sp. DW29H23 TaxID=3421241 RepID=UPI003D680D99